MVVLIIVFVIIIIIGLFILLNICVSIIDDQQGYDELCTCCGLSARPESCY